VLQEGSDTRYVVDWQRLFEKAWPDMPTTPIPIESVAFANEVVGAVHLHTAVSDVRRSVVGSQTETMISCGPSSLSGASQRARRVIGIKVPSGAVASVDIGSHEFSWRVPGVIAGALTGVALGVAAAALMPVRRDGTGRIVTTAGVGYAYVTSQMGTRLTGDPRDIALRDALYSAIRAS
jgi:hypothetical protein